MVREFSDVCRRHGIVMGFYVSPCVRNHPCYGKAECPVRHLQPEAVVFSDIGPDHRWVGNEKGLADSDASTCYTPCVPESETEPVSGYTCYRERKTGTY